MTDKPSSITNNATSKRNKARNRKDVRLIFAFICVVLLLGVAMVSYILFSNKSKNVLDSSKESIAKLIDNQTETREMRQITSSLGFSLSYDNKTITADGQTTDTSSTDKYVTGQSYENDELQTTREYSILRFYLRDASNDTKNSANMFTTQKPYLSAITNIRKNYFTDKEALPEYAGLSKIDILVKSQNQKKVTDASITASDATEVKIGSLTYKRVIYTTTFGSGDLQTKRQETSYYIVQNDRPYMYSIYSTSDNEQYNSELEAIIATAAYASPDESKLGLQKPMIVTASTSTQTLPSGTSNIPDKLSKDTIVDVVLRNQPAVLRIGTIRCGDIVLSKNSTTVTLKNACNGGTGSGSFVSQDGYIATNGHVVSVNTSDLIFGYLSMASDASQAKSRFQELLTFLLDSDAVTNNDIDQLRSYIASGAITEEEAVRKITEVVAAYASPKNDTTNYVVQISDEPMRFDSSSEKLSFKYTDKNIKATFVGMNFDQNNTQNLTETTKMSDVAILKTESSGPFPTVKVTDFSSAKSGDLLTAIGYPGFVDNALYTTQDKTVPTITQGTLKSYEKIGSYQLALTDVPIAHGNSGGPSFNTKGEQIGFNTYGTIDCADGNCFGDGIVRNAKDFTDLAKEKSVNLNQTSTTTETWNKAIDTFLTGNFKSAKKQFEAIQKSYPANYLAAPLASIASSKIGTPDDRSSEFETSPLLIYGLIALGTLLLISIITILIIARKHHKQHGNRRDFNQDNNSDNISNSVITQPGISSSQTVIEPITPTEGTTTPPTPNYIQPQNNQPAAAIVPPTALSEQTIPVSNPTTASLNSAPINVQPVELHIPGGMPDPNDIPKPEEIFIPKMKDLNPVPAETNIEFVSPTPQPISGQVSTVTSNVMDIIPPRASQNNAPNRLDG